MIYALRPLPTLALLCAAFLKLSSASTRERLSVESCMLRMCRQHTDLRGSGPILFSCKKTTNFWIFCIRAKPAARPRQPLSPRRSDVLGSNPSSPESCIMGNRAPLKPAALRKLCAEDDSRTLQLLRSMRKPFGRKLSLKSPKASFAAPVSKTLLASTAPELTYTLSQTSSNPIQPKLAQL